jgi:hypothetical protein
LQVIQAGQGPFENLRYEVFGHLYRADAKAQVGEDTRIVFPVQVIEGNLLLAGMDDLRLISLRTLLLLGLLERQRP